MVRSRGLNHRNPFNAPEEFAEDNAQPEAIDEQEQEALITKLRAQDEAQNTLYRKAFALIILALCPIFLMALPTGVGALPILLSITSLSLTSYTLLSLPLHAQQTPFPLSYLPFLNLTLSLLAAVNGGIKSRVLRGGVDEVSWVVWYIPVVVCGVAEVLRYWMRGVEADISGLEGLKYKYKGA
ncbi:hypothetical protein SAICODRAFT_6533 [Saitoella complicata NRRL Y-17804]|uniref:Uncharacterized protein n=1 Tax=Saitoella complicata (strain BCRC 22490 / CBS 7301 / JCM 7358 / NBRC 10748 / NRRL Y-17804) TaxID=698492 RepID=A0A0E9NFJ0_SAICN|nr:uncharacterized protein SAICODRAFT_6533 [Saitoella complicata NRRL Y-17804]ODQ54250.1 hypothetical protein SAICODRAFT_6533 [Saitoella complicata NRRL Y-17804]GAO48583.1 hypothetical protein G7K_2756-t1 [Saitoella complicata NRRL Y-17804]